MKVASLIAALAALALATSAAAASGQNSISAPDGIHYGDLFTPQATFAKNVKDPWAFAVCHANASSVTADGYEVGDEIWSGYRSLTGLTGEQFLAADPIANIWLGGGADCRLDLVDFKGSQRIVLASAEFSVSA